MPSFFHIGAQARRAFKGGAATLFALAATVASAGVGFNAPVKYPVAGSPFLRVVADFNADGKPDLASSDSAGNTVEVLINNGSGGFTTTSYAVGSQPTNVVSCDTNGDGRPDLIVGNRGSNSFSVLVNQGGGVFAPAVHYPIGETPAFLACTTNAANTAHFIRITTTAGFLRQYSDTVGPTPVMGTFALLASAALGSDPRYFIVPDLDNDGDADPAIVNYGSNTVSVLKQAPGPVYAKTDYAVGAGPVFVGATDLSGDNFADLIVVNQLGNSISVLLNNGDATFNAATTYAVGVKPGAEAHGDFNGDGKADIVVRNETSKSVSVLINKGNGTFFAAVEIALPGTPVTLNLADFDGDGKLDIVLGISDAGGVAVLLGRGDGSFQAPLLIPVGNGPRSSVQVVDLNGDGRTDIVLPLSGEGAIAVLINSGAAATATSGTFFAAPTGSGSGSSGISIAGGGPSCAFSYAAFIPTTGAAASPPTSIPGAVTYKFPHGLADFRTTGCTVGATLTVTVTYPNALPNGTQYWKYGPTASNSSSHWYVMPATIVGNTVTFTIVDGGLGDDDLNANGVIIDVGGPAWPDCSTLQGGLACSLDVDGNGLLEPQKDGLLILRRLMGFSGNSLTSGVTFASNACRGTAEAVAGFIDAQQFDVDQSGGLLPTKALSDGLILLRVMLGLTDSAVTAGVTTQSWANIRTYLNTQCGMSLPGGTANTPPVITGLSDSTVTLPAYTLALNPTVTDDGLPAPANLTYAWSRVSGPQPVFFGATSDTPPDLSTVASSTAAQTSTLRNPAAFFDFNGAGSYVLRLSASDGALTTTKNITVTVVAQAAAAPSIGPFANRVMNLGDTLSLGLAGQDANSGDQLMYNLLSAPSGAALTPTGSPRFSFTPTAAQLGVQNVTIQVRDPASQTAQASFTITVQAANRPPQFTAASKANGVATVGAVFTRTLVAIDPDAGDTLSYSLIGGPNGLTVSPSGALSWTPTAAQRGDQVVKIAVSDGAGGTDQAIFRLTVGNNAPPIAKNDNYVAQVGHTLTVTAADGVLKNDVDPDGDVLTASKLSDPALGTLSSFSSDGSFNYVAPAVPPEQPITWQKRLNLPGVNFGGTFNYYVGDVNNDGYPDVLQHTSNYDISAVSGRDGTLLWTYDNAGASDCNHFLTSSGHRLWADIDDTGKLTHVLQVGCSRDEGDISSSDRILAINELGKVKWVSPPLSMPHPDKRIGTTPVPPGGFPIGKVATGRGISTARLTANGKPVLLMRGELRASNGYTQYQDANGAFHQAGCRAVTGLPADEGTNCRFTLIIDGSNGAVLQRLIAPLPNNRAFNGDLYSNLSELPPIAYDINGDGRVDLVSGGEVWYQNPSGGFDLGWQLTVPVSDTVVADLDGDGKPEIIVMRSLSQSNGYGTPDPEVGISIHAHDGTLKARIPISSDSFMPMSVADVDGDGQSEILIGADDVLYAYRADGTAVWARKVLPETSTDPVFGSSPPRPYYDRFVRAAPQVYDLDGDGINEVIFASDAGLQILNGRTGERLLGPQFTYSVKSSGLGSLFLIDFDNDGQVEIYADGNFRFYCFNGNPTPAQCAEVVGPVMKAGPGQTWLPGPKIAPQLQFRSSSFNNATSSPRHDTSVSRRFRVPEQLGSPRDPALAKTTVFDYAASDPWGSSSSAQVRIRIEPDNRPPVFTSTPPVSLQLRYDSSSPTGQFQHFYQPTAIDPDAGDTVSFSLKHASPANLVAMDSATGRISFAPQGGALYTLGWVTVIVTATDSRGASSDQTFIVNLTTTAVTVPNVVGQLIDVANANLLLVNLFGRAATQVFNSAPVGTVTDQVAVAGASVGEFDQIRLTVSKGPAPVIVPNVVDLAETLALTRLSALGFNVSVTRQFASAPFGTVISQSLSAGSTVVPGAMSIVVSGGTGLELKLSRIVITGSESLNLLPAAFDASGVPAALPSLTYSVVAKQLPILGTMPTISGTAVSSAASTLGSFTVTATDSVGGRSASADFVVMKASSPDGKTNGAVIAHMLSVLTQMDALAPALRAARAANDTAQMRTLLTQYVTIWRTVDVARMKLTVPISLPVGFVPSEAEMTAFGVSPQAEDFLIQQILNEASDDLRAWSAGLRASGTSLADLRTLADTFSTRAARINSLSISEYGGVMNHPQMIQLIGHDIPEFYEAFTDELAVVVGLPRRAPDFPNFKRARGDQKSTLAEVVVTTAVDMVIEKVMDQAAQTYKNAKKFAFDTMKFAAYSSAILATYTHFKQFAYGKDLEEVVSGASLSFREFKAGYSFIEVATATRRRTSFTVMVIGPSLFTNAATGIKATIDKLKDATSYGKDALSNPNRVKHSDDLFKIHDEFKDKVDALVNAGSNTIKNATKQFYQSPNDIEHSCIFTATVPCQQLLYDAGFESVYEYAPPPGFGALGGIPVPIIFIVQDNVTSDMFFGIKAFLPTLPVP